MFKISDFAEKDKSQLLKTEKTTINKITENIYQRNSNIRKVKIEETSKIQKFFILAVLSLKKFQNQIF